jgi:hypothetical protein
LFLVQRQKGFFPTVLFARFAPQRGPLNRPLRENALLGFSGSGLSQVFQQLDALPHSFPMRQAQGSPGPFSFDEPLQRGDLPAARHQRPMVLDAVPLFRRMVHMDKAHPLGKALRHGVNVGDRINAC